MKKTIENKELFGDALALSGMYAIRNFASDEDAYLRYAAIHYVDLIRFLLGEVVDISGFKLNPGKDVNHTFCFTTEGGQIGNMYFAGVPSWGRHYEEVTITGTKGYVKVENREKVITHFITETTSKVPAWQTLNEKAQTLTSVQTSSSGGWQSLYLNGYVGEVEHFLNSITNEIKPTPSADDNVKTVELCDRLIKTLIDKSK